MGLSLPLFFALLCWGSVLVVPVALKYAAQRAARGQGRNPAEASRRIRHFEELWFKAYPWVLIAGTGALILGVLTVMRTPQ